MVLFIPKLQHVLFGEGIAALIKTHQFHFKTSILLKIQFNYSLVISSGTIYSEGPSHIFLSCLLLDTVHGWNI